MKTDNDDILIRKFLQENKQEVPDHFFTKKVMQRLPERNNHEWILILSAGIGTVISLILGHDYQLPDLANLAHASILQNINIYLLLGSIAAFPLISGLGILLFRNKKINLF